VLSTVLDIGGGIAMEKLKIKVGTLVLGALLLVVNVCTIIIIWNPAILVSVAVGLNLI
jgi:hypothetical protein